MGGSIANAAAGSLPVERKTQTLGSSCLQSNTHAPSKAADTLPEGQQIFIAKMAVKMSLGVQLTVEENGLITKYMMNGLNLLNEADHKRYFYLRSEALEQALKRE